VDLKDKWRNIKLKVQKAGQKIEDRLMEVDDDDNATNNTENNLEATGENEQNNTTEDTTEHE